MPSNNDKKKYNATCAICGKPYNMCYSCDKKNAQLVWKRFCDTPEHYKIYQVVHGYTTGLYTKAEADKKLKNIDTSDIDKLRPNIREILMDIISEDVVNVDKNITEENSVEKVEDAKVNEAELEHKATRSSTETSDTNTVEPSTKPKEPSTKACRTHKRTTVKTESESKESEATEA